MDVGTPVPHWLSYAYFRGVNSPVIKPSPSLTFPGSTILSSGRPRGGNSGIRGPFCGLIFGIKDGCTSGRGRDGNSSRSLVAMIFLLETGLAQPGLAEKHGTVGGNAPGKKPGEITGK